MAPDTGCLRAGAARVVITLPLGTAIPGGGMAVPRRQYTMTYTSMPWHSPRVTCSLRSSVSKRPQWLELPADPTDPELATFLLYGWGRGDVAVKKEGGHEAWAARSGDRRGPC